MPNSKWRRILRLIERCGERGWRTFLVWSGMPRDPAISQPFLDAGCEILVEPRASGNFDLRCVGRTFRLLRRIGCDIFHCHNVHTSPLIAAAMAGVPVRVWSRLAMSPFYEEARPPAGLHRLQLSHRVSGALAHVVLCISRAVRDELRDLGVPEHKLIVRPVPVDSEEYGTSRPGAIRGEFGIPADATLITTVGHAVPVKGWDVLLDAFTLAAPRIPDAHLLLVGSLDAPDERAIAEALRQSARERGLEPRVHFAGARRDVPAILAASDVFVLPSRSEGLSSALVEAMTAGLPCIAARVGGAPEAVDNGASGLLFEREDRDQLAELLVETVSDPVLRHQLGLQAARSAQRYNLEASIGRLIALYERFLARPGRVMPAELLQ